MNYWCYQYNFIQKTCFENTVEDRYSSIDQYVLSLPIGVYTTVRTVQKTRIFQFKFHLERLVESINLSGAYFPYCIDDIRQSLFRIIENFPSNEVRIRFYIPLNDVDICFIILEELVIPTKIAYKIGIKVNTNTLTRENPKAKLTSFITKSEKIKRFCRENGFEESLMLNANNNLLEGLSSNFFAVIHGEIYTAENDVLDGATRRIILEEAHKENLTIHLKPINYDQLGSISEAFISSTSRGVLPVIFVDGFQINDGKPGRITTYLINRLNERMIDESEKII
ncbi:MAG: aminotransferase class IV [Anaerolineaceae bacterium]|nr:aminotransferase class IV [Anaerolineaceae bacterium]